MKRYPYIPMPDEYRKIMKEKRKHNTREFIVTMAWWAFWFTVIMALLYLRFQPEWVRAGEYCAIGCF